MNARGRSEGLVCLQIARSPRYTVKSNAAVLSVEYRKDNGVNNAVQVGGDSRMMVEAS